MTRAEDLWLIEDPDLFPLLKVYEETLSGTMTIRLQLYGYTAFTSRRYSQASSVITGTGLVAPTF